MLCERCGTFAIDWITCVKNGVSLPRKDERIDAKSVLSVDVAGDRNATIGRTTMA